MQWTVDSYFLRLMVPRFLLVCSCVACPRFGRVGAGGRPVPIPPVAQCLVLRYLEPPCWILNPSIPRRLLSTLVSWITNWPNHGPRTCQLCSHSLPPAQLPSWPCLRCSSWTGCSVLTLCASFKTSHCLSAQRLSITQHALGSTFSLGGVEFLQ